MAIKCLEPILFHRRLSLANRPARYPTHHNPLPVPNSAESYYRDCVPEQFVTLPTSLT